MSIQSTNVQFADATVRIKCHGNDRMYDQNAAELKAAEIYKTVKESFGMTCEVTDDSKSKGDQFDYCLHLKVQTKTSFSGAEKEQLSLGMLEALVQLEGMVSQESELQQEGFSFEVEVADFHESTYQELTLQHTDAVVRQNTKDRSENLSDDIVVDVAVDLVSFTHVYPEIGKAETTSTVCKFLQSTFSHGVAADFDVRFNIHEHDDGWVSCIVGLNFKSDVSGDRIFGLMHFNDRLDMVRDQFSENEFVRIQVATNHNVETLHVMQHVGNKTVH